MFFTHDFLQGKQELSVSVEKRFNELLGNSVQHTLGGRRCVPAGVRGLPVSSTTIKEDPIFVLRVSFSSEHLGLADISTCLLPISLC